eukprot:6765227-Lingulodinium_polyedra.AAC.1
MSSLAYAGSSAPSCRAVAGWAGFGCCAREVAVLGEGGAAAASVVQPWRGDKAGDGGAVVR